MPNQSNCSEKDIANIITPLFLSNIINSIINKLPLEKQKSISRQQISLFNATTRPEIELPSYISRIKKYSACDANDFAYCSIILIIYLDKYIHTTKKSLTVYNAHRLLATAYLLAFKQHCDVYNITHYFARIAGISLSQLNRSERQFFSDVEYLLHVPLKTFNKYKKYLILKATEEAADMEISPSR